MHAHRFTALGTYAHLASSGDPGRAVAVAREVLTAVDLGCSRFRRDSDLSRANARAGSWTRVSSLCVAAVTVALEAARATDGLVDPCLGLNLADLGYDADLDLVRRRPAAPARWRFARPDAWTEVDTDPAGAIRVPVGVALDLGATAKAWAADLVAARVAEAVGGSVLVSLGGDVSTAGPPRAWPVRIHEHPDGVGDTVPAATVTIENGGLATSSTRVRRWRAGGVEQHHLLDPRTARPVTGPWRTVTATGPSAVSANVAATAALVLQAEAPAWLAAHDVDARLIGDEGQQLTCGLWPAPHEEELACSST